MKLFSKKAWKPAKAGIHPGIFSPPTNLDRAIWHNSSPKDQTGESWYENPGEDWGHRQNTHYPMHSETFFEIVIRAASESSLCQSASSVRYVRQSCPTGWSSYPYSDT